MLNEFFDKELALESQLAKLCDFFDLDQLLLLRRAPFIFGFIEDLSF